MVTRFTFLQISDVFCVGEQTQKFHAIKQNIHTVIVTQGLHVRMLFVHDVKIETIRDLANGESRKRVEIYPQMDFRCNGA